MRSSSPRGEQDLHTLQSWEQRLRSKESHCKGVAMQVTIKSIAITNDEHYFLLINNTRYLV
jgi:hypothetical protein